MNKTSKDELSIIILSYYVNVVDDFFLLFYTTSLKEALWFVQIVEETAKIKIATYATAKEPYQTNKGNGITSDSYSKQ